MPLTRTEKERISDNRMKIRSVKNSLSHIDPAKIDDYEAIQDCLKDAEKSLSGALSEGAGGESSV
jgi:hypothetical protein